MAGSERPSNVPPAAQVLTLREPFRLRRGGTLAAVDIAYETWGELDASAGNAVLVLTGLSPSSHAASSSADPKPGWWEDMIGPGKPIDTDRLFVVCVNSLGSCFGSTGPASIDPATGNAYRLSFPVLSLEDVASAAHAVVRHLGIERLLGVVGPSMGGMSALAYCLQYPCEVEALVSISSAARSLPFAIALRSLQREMIRSDPEWHQGQYPLGDGPIRGMRLARKLGMITYRSAEEWRQRFGRERVADARSETDGTNGAGPFGIEFEVESYLEAHARRFTGAFDANCYLYLSHAMDLFDATDHGSNPECGSGRPDGLRHVLVVGAVTDFLFPIDQQRELAKMLEAPERNVTMVELPSLQGHDSFLVDMDRFRPPINDFFESLGGSR
ncbi:MAG: homoserine O-acetyltransferase [Pseudomonadota bacterium]